MSSATFSDVQKSFTVIILRLRDFCFVLICFVAVLGVESKAFSLSYIPSSFLILHFETGACNH